MKTAYSPDWDLSTIPLETLNAEFGKRYHGRRKRNTPGTGRPKVLRTCVCGGRFGVVEMKQHLKDCPKRGAAVSAEIERRSCEAIDDMGIPIQEGAGRLRNFLRANYGANYSAAGCRRLWESYLAKRGVVLL